MAFSFFRWLGGKQQDAPTEVSAAEFFDLTADTYIRELAIESCINLIAGTATRCEFTTFRSGAPVREAEFYSWNVAPNRNQSAAAFRHKLMHKLLYDREALVLTIDGKRYVADSFTRNRKTLYDSTFTNVQVDDLTLERTYYSSEVLYFELSEKSMRKIVEGLYLSYGKLISCGMKGYKSARGEKGVLELDIQAAGDEKFTNTYEKIKNEGFRRFAEADNAVLPLYKGMHYTALHDGKTYSSETTRDIRAMIDDVTDFTCRAYGIPPVLLSGKVENVDEAVRQMMTFCIDPLLRGVIETEINAKLYTAKDIAEGTCLRIDTTHIQHVDLFGDANKINQLVSSGCFSVNDILRALGQSEINELWANEHFITKNYATVREVIANAKGGETK